VIEIDSPFSIASASLDSTIRLYSLVDKAEISVLSEHSKGVRCLSYNSNYGGFILSAGFERNIYVWSPEVTTRKSLIGKLEGHTEIVVTVKFLNTRPFCVSIDEKFNLRFWDVRTLNGV
jgi:WD40 repeat protein